MEFSRQEYWSGLPFPTPEDLPDPEIKTCLLRPLHWQEVFFFLIARATWEAPLLYS